MEVFRIWNTQTTHSMLMSPFLEVSFKSPSTPIAIIAAYLTFKLLKIITRQSRCKAARKKRWSYTAEPKFISTAKRLKMCTKPAVSGDL